MKWNDKQANNIPSNPLEYHWAFVPYRHVALNDPKPKGRLFLIYEQFPSEDGICIKDGDDPELFILFENSGYLDQDGNPVETGHPTFLRAFKTIDEAKKRAEYNVQHINALIDAYFPE